MPHSTGTGGVPTFSLCSPFVRACLGGRVTAGSAGLVLFVERSPATSTTLSMGLAVALTKGGGTFRHLEVVSSVVGIPIDCLDGSVLGCWMLSLRRSRFLAW